MRKMRYQLPYQLMELINHQKNGGIAFEGTIDVEDQRFDFTKMILVINKYRMAGLKNSDTVLHAYFGDKLTRCASFELPKIYEWKTPTYYVTYH